jgi:hypothetical protein
MSQSENGADGLRGRRRIPGIATPSALRISVNAYDTLMGQLIKPPGAYGGDIRPCANNWDLLASHIRAPSLFPLTSPPEDLVVTACRWVIKSRGFIGPRYARLPA